MKSVLSIHWALITSLWYFGNGILHDVFVVINHKGKYDRDLLRLLMDGHVLMLSGSVLFVSYLMMLEKIPYAGILGIIVGISMLIYCAMVFPFLKSFVTIAISLILIIVSLKTQYSQAV